MKIVAIFLIGFALGFETANIGPHKIISSTSKGIETGSKATVKALDSVNKKISQ